MCLNIYTNVVMDFKTMPSYQIKSYTLLQIKEKTSLTDQAYTE